MTERPKLCPDFIEDSHQCKIALKRDDEVVDCINLLDFDGCPYRDDVRSRSSREEAEYMGEPLLKEPR